MESSYNLQTRNADLASQRLSLIALGSGSVCLITAVVVVILLSSSGMRFPNCLLIGIPATALLVFCVSLTYACCLRRRENPLEEASVLLEVTTSPVSPEYSPISEVMVDTSDGGDGVYRYYMEGGDRRYIDGVPAITPSDNKDVSAHIALTKSDEVLVPNLETAACVSMGGDDRRYIDGVPAITPSDNKDVSAHIALTKSDEVLVPNLETAACVSTEEPTIEEPVIEEWAFPPYPTITITPPDEVLVANPVTAVFVSMPSKSTAPLKAPPPRPLQTRKIVEELSPLPAVSLSSTELTFSGLPLVARSALLPMIQFLCDYVAKHDAAHGICEEESAQRQREVARACHLLASYAEEPVKATQLPTLLRALLPTVGALFTSFLRIYQNSLPPQAQERIPATYEQTVAEGIGHLMEATEAFEEELTSLRRVIPAFFELFPPVLADILCTVIDAYNSAHHSSSKTEQEMIREALSLLQELVSSILRQPETALRWILTGPRRIPLNVLGFNIEKRLPAWSPHDDIYPALGYWGALALYLKIERSSDFSSLSVKNLQELATLITVHDKEGKEDPFGRVIREIVLFLIARSPQDIKITHELKKLQTLHLEWTRDLNPKEKREFIEQANSCMQHYPPSELLRETLAAIERDGNDPRTELVKTFFSSLAEIQKKIASKIGQLEALHMQWMKDPTASSKAAFLAQARECIADLSQPSSLFSSPLREQELKAIEKGGTDPNAKRVKNFLSALKKKGEEINRSHEKLTIKRAFWRKIQDDERKACIDVVVELIDTLFTKVFDAQVHKKAFFDHLEQLINRIGKKEPKRDLGEINKLKETLFKEGVPHEQLTVTLLFSLHAIPSCDQPLLHRLESALHMWKERYADTAPHMEGWLKGAFAFISKVKNPLHSLKEVPAVAHLQAAPLFKALNRSLLPKEPRHNTAPASVEKEASNDMPTITEAEEREEPVPKTIEEALSTPMALLQWLAKKAGPSFAFFFAKRLVKNQLGEQRIITEEEVEKLFKIAEKLIDAFFAAGLSLAIDEKRGKRTPENRLFMDRLPFIFNSTCSHKEAPPFSRGVKVLMSATSGVLLAPVTRPSELNRVDKDIAKIARVQILNGLRLAESFRDDPVHQALHSILTILGPMEMDFALKGDAAGEKVAISSEKALSAYLSDLFEMITGVWPDHPLTVEEERAVPPAPPSLHEQLVALEKEFAFLLDPSNVDKMIDSAIVTALEQGGLSTHSLEGPERPAVALSGSGDASSAAPLLQSAESFHE